MSISILSVCRQLLGPQCPEEYVVQVVRVLGHVLDEDALAGLGTAADVLRAIHTAKLIPGKLLDVCRRHRAPADVVSWEDAAIAVCFAASIYPMRAYQLAPEEIGPRFASFIEIYRRLEAEAATEQSFQPSRILDVLQSRHNSITPDQLGACVSDLSAESFGPDAMPAERERRRTGAAIYLGSCSPELIGITCNYWAEEAAFLRCFRRYLPTPPSYLAREDQREQFRPNWTSVRLQLERLYPGLPAEHYDRAIMLEQAVWNEAGRWVHQNRIPERVLEFWDRQWDKLSSGFPYYAFLSRFPHWWKQCLARFRFSSAEVEPLDDDVGHPPPPRPPDQLDPVRIRSIREGYRLLRTTFFPRADQGLGGRKSPAERNDFLRTVLDELWYARLASGIEADLPPAMVKDIASLYGNDFSEDVVNNLSHRLRRRMWAYELARFRSWRNSQIRSAHRPREGRIGTGEFPLARESGVDAIASLARLAAPRHTLLWALTARLFLHSSVEPQRPDPWSFERYLVELWHWVKDPNFDEALARGAAEGRRSDLLANAALRESPFRELVAALRSQNEEADVNAWVRSREFGDERRAARKLLETVAAPGLRAWSERSLRQWRGVAPNHWIVPVWYLLFIEQCDPADVPSRLQPDAHENAQISDLVRMMLAAGETQSARTPLRRGLR